LVLSPTTWALPMMLVVTLSAPHAAAGASGDGGVSCPRLAAPGYCGDDGPAERAGLSMPTDVAVRPEGGFVIADAGNDAIRDVTATGRIRTLAGPATATGRAHLKLPGGVAALPRGRTLVADTGNNRVVLVEPRGTLRIVAGDGVAGGRGDGGPAPRARLSGPMAVVPARDGGLIIADTGNNRVRLVRTDGIIITIAGTGRPGFSGDGGPATAARLERPVDVAVLADGAIVIATADGRLRRVERDATIRSLPARVRGEPAVAALPDGTLAVSEPAAHRVLRLGLGALALSAPDAIIAQGAGCVPRRRQSEPGPAKLRYPAGLSVTPMGEILVADTGAHRILRAAPGGVHVVVGAGLGLPAIHCGEHATPDEVLARLRAGSNAIDRDYPPPLPPPPPLRPSPGGAPAGSTSPPPGARPPGPCFDRASWSFNIRYLFTEPERPRVRQRFEMVFSASARVFVRLTARRGQFKAAVPRRQMLISHSRFSLRFPRGLPHAGTYRMRLVARRSLNSPTQCLDRRLRIRRHGGHERAENHAASQVPQ
jgi:hypothetical protein